MQNRILSMLDTTPIKANDGNDVYYVKNNIYVYPTTIFIDKFQGFELYEMNNTGECVPKTNGKTFIITDDRVHRYDLKVSTTGLVAEDEMDFFNFVNIITIFKL